MSLPFNSPMRIDSKGKYYTKIVSTNRLEVILHLNSGMIIQGAVHIRSDQRLSDELNDIQPFLSVTAATVLRDGAVLYESSYIAVNRRSIEWILPNAAIGEQDEDENDE